MKILELTNYTAGGCGVGSRVLKESKLLALRGHHVKVFSSNIIKGSNKICSSREVLENIEITRFAAKKLGGESYMTWKFEKEAIDFNPDVIISHSYRHLHTHSALKLAKKIGCKVFLVAHAPFDRKSSRTLLQNLVVSLYDSLLGKSKLKKFTKVIAISRWEIPYLLNLGLTKNKIVYIPNGIEEEFFRKKANSKEKKEIIYMGRISPIKNIEELILAIPIMKSSFKLKIVGPAEENYLAYLKSIIKNEKLEDRVEIIDKIYNREEQIRFLDSAEIFVLPSLSEGMPQTLIEAMARSKIVIGKLNKGNLDIIINDKNGFLFSNSKELAKIIEDIEVMKPIDKNKIKKSALKKAGEFKWKNIIDNLESVLSK